MGITYLLRYKKTWVNTAMILNCKKLFSEVLNWYEETKEVHRISTKRSMK